MEIRSSEEARSNIESFAKRYGALLKEKKALDMDIKALKDEFKEEGVPVGIVTSMFNKIKAEKKKTDSQLFEEETIKEWLEACEQVQDDISELNVK